MQRSLAASASVASTQAAWMNFEDIAVRGSGVEQPGAVKYADNQNTSSCWAASLQEEGKY